MALSPLAPETRNLIDGRLVPASNGGTFENLNPATGQGLGTGHTRGSRRTPAAASGEAPARGRVQHGSHRRLPWEGGTSVPGGRGRDRGRWHR